MEYISISRKRPAFYLRLRGREITTYHFRAVSVQLNGVVHVNRRHCPSVDEWNVTLGTACSGSD